jgi:hypothetical protein
MPIEGVLDEREREPVPSAHDHQSICVRASLATEKQNLRDQWDRASTGLPSLSLIWVDHTLLMAPTTLSGIGT